MKVWFRFVRIQKLYDSCILFEKHNKVHLQAKTNLNEEFNKDKDTFQKKESVSNKNRCKSKELFVM